MIFEDYLKVVSKHKTKTDEKIKLKRLTDNEKKEQ